MNIQQMMKQAQSLQKKFGEMQKVLESSEVTGESGGGMVKIMRAVKGDFKTVEIDPKLFDDKEMLEDLILAALNDGNRKAALAMEQKMGDFDIPTSASDMLL
jgi:nucleoid-associated protein EbfC